MPIKRKWRDLIPPANKTANPLFITEYMNRLQISDATLARAFKVRRETAFRWRTEQSRLAVKEAMAIAAFLKTDLAGLMKPPPEPDSFEEVSFDVAGRHITAKEDRERVAKILQDIRGSRG